MSDDDDEDVLNTPWTVVFVPSEGDPGKLLTGGPGGGVPPRGWLCLHCECPAYGGLPQTHYEGCTGTGPTWDTDPEFAYRSIEKGLLLRDRDMTVMPGYDRLTWALWESGKYNRLEVTSLRKWLPFDDGDLEGLEQAIEWAVAAGFGTVIRLDKQGGVL